MQDPEQALDQRLEAQRREQHDADIKRLRRKRRKASRQGWLALKRAVSDQSNDPSN